MKNLPLEPKLVQNIDQQYKVIVCTHCPTMCGTDVWGCLTETTIEPVEVDSPKHAKILTNHGVIAEDCPATWPE